MKLLTLYLPSDGFCYCTCLICVECDHYIGIMDLVVICGCGFLDVANLIGGLLLEELSLPLCCTVHKSVGMGLRRKCLFVQLLWNNI